MDLLELVESFQQESASVQQIFGNDGTSIRSASARGRQNPRYVQALAETARSVV